MINTSIEDKKGDICSSDNYRGIALASVLTKILDLVILNRHSDLFMTSDMQFALKKKSSTTMCIYSFKETIKYYNDNDSNVYCCMVDASKAFDRLRFDKLFQILKNKDIPPYVLNILMTMYTQQQLRTSWDGVNSPYFSISNGVRQGGILSPILFTLYMDTLLKRLESHGIGCHIGHYYYGALSYADDLALLCPSVSGLQEMLNICDEFSKEFDVQFNAKKTVSICFSRDRTPVNFSVSLQGTNLKCDSSVKYLGCFIEHNLSEATEIRIKKNDFVARTNSLIYTFQSTSKRTLFRLFETNCCALYGCQTWQLDDPTINRLFTSWNIAIRKIFDLPARAHTNLLPQIIDRPLISFQIANRFLKMFGAMLISTNVRVKFLASYACDNNQCILRKNLNWIAQLFDVNIYDIISGCFKFVLNNSMDWRAKLINELIDIIDGNLNIDLEITDIKELLNLLVTEE